MKVLHLSTFDIGGAAVAALRLHYGLQYEGIDSQFLSLYSYDSGGFGKVSYMSFLQQNLRERISASVKYRFQKLLYKKVDGFSYPFSPFNLHYHPLVMNADVIHLHWVSKFVDLSSFLKAMKKLKKPIVWTLHDLNTITGGYHYLESFNINSRLNNKYFYLKKNMFISNDNIYFVSPSRWIYNLILETGFASKEKVQLIKYGINLEEFFPENKIKSKLKLDINLSKIVVLFVASNLNDKRKGLSYFLNAISLLPDDKKIQILCVGSGECRFPSNIECKYMGNIQCLQDLRTIYSAADFMVIPSLEDNLPNVILESLACGTPVIGFNTGGIPDIVVNDLNGFVAKNRNEKDLAEKITLLIESKDKLKELSINARSFAEEHLDNQLQCQKYISLYKNII